MRVIDKDPRLIIPDIHESDVERFIVASLQITNNDNTFAHFARKEDNKVFFEGDLLYDNINNQYATRWSDSYNVGHTSILSLIIAQWHAHSPPWNTKFLVLESYDEVMNFLDSNKVGGQLRQHVIDSWNAKSGE